ncbi:hypothetical protein [Ferrovibrio sp.]|uniref:hypothetical protein n=1 Tax=Ferrovibrio sp. TaxID=1917215 RepID=UPI0026185B38|nr:hypothetical protein [Ferrovibrio sp.]
MHRSATSVVLLGLLVALSWASAAQAQGGQSPGQGPGQGLAQSSRPADSATEPLPVVVTLDAAECRRLLARQGSVTMHQPAPDVTYQPGRDVDSQGRPIAPADLPGSNPYPMDGPITLDLKIPLSTLLGDRTPPRVGSSETNVGKVTIDPKTGRLAFNGQSLEPKGEDALAAACRDYLARQKPPRR